MRIPSDMPRPGRRPRRGPRRPGRGRVVLVVVAVALVVLALSLRGIAGFYTDYLWFDSLGHEDVFRGVLRAKATLVVLFTAVFFALLWANLYVAERVAPTFRPAGPEDELVARYRAAVGPRKGLVHLGVALLFALVAGTPASSQWRQWLLFNNSVDFGTDDPLFGRDVGFYVFRLPFLSYVVDWLFAALMIVLVVTAAFHYLNGGIRVQAPAPQRVTPQVKVHLSVLLGLLAIVKAAAYWLQRFDLTTSTRGTVDGATYTDVNAQLPAINLLALIALAAAVLFLLNIRRKGWVLPVLGIGIWAVVAVVGGAIVPAAVQRFRVEPAEFSREQEFIVDNIEATRVAMGLDGVESQRFAGEAELTEDDLFANADVIKNIRLWDTDQLERTYQQLQALRPFYAINEVDVDRYEIDGELTQVMISARELDSDDVPQQSWEATHLSFTHGYGVVMSPANAKEATGRPDLIVSDVPVVDEAGLGIEPDRAGIYFGEALSGYVIVGTDRDEIDYETEEITETTRYDGEDGVSIGSWLRRAAFSLRFGDFNPIFSGNLRGESRILYNRDIVDRVSQLAPFLDLDGDPYPVVVDGRIKWIIDAYTTTDRYPYAQRAVLDGLGGEDLDHRFNYIRNSVKAVVDAYDGTVTFYVVDDEDPIIRAWMSAFPDLLTTEAPPEELRAHFRYPEDMFRVQTNMWGRYHIGPEQPSDFFNNIGAWTVAADPGLEVPQPGSAPTTSTTIDPQAPPTEENRIEPYYLLTRLPGDDDQSFVLLRPYVPVRSNRPVLTAFLVASSDPDDYGRLVSYETPPQVSVDGPGIVAGTISTDQDVSQDQTVLCQRGADCRFGNLVFVPIGESLLYVQPLYLIAEGNDVPLLRKVVVEYRGQVGYADTLREAMLQLFDDVPETLEEEGPAGGGEGGAGGEDEPVADVAELLAEAEELFARADEALASGGAAGLAEYGELVEEAREVLRQAVELLAAETGELPAPGDGGAAGDEPAGGDEPADATSTSSSTTVREPESA